MEIPQSLRDRPQWLVWRFEKNPDPRKTKPLKVPYYAAGKRRHGDQGTPGDRRQLVKFDVALAACGLGKFEGVGFAFLPDDGLIGIDLDKVIDKDTGEISELAIEIIKRCGSYTEYSPSKTGVHIILAGDTKVLYADGQRHSFKSNKIGVEVYCGALFFTFTGERYSGTPAEVRPIELEVLRWLYSVVKPQETAASSTQAAPATPARSNVLSFDNDQRRADAALCYVDAEDYETWIRVGMALKHEFGEAGFSSWDRWSQKSSKYPGMTEAAKKWQTFSPDGRIKLGVVFELARQAGYSPPPRPRAPKGSKSAKGPAHPGGKGDARPPEPPPEDPPGAKGGGDGGDDQDARPRIKWKAGELPDVVDQAEDSLLRSGIRIYQRAGFLVRVVKRDTPSVRNYKRPAGTLGLVTVDAPYLTESFTRAAVWLKYDARKDSWKRANAPEAVAAHYIARVGHWQLPRLWAPISAPTLRPDGTLLQEPGYDRDTQSWYDPCGITFPVISENPDVNDARAALAKLRQAFSTFPFASKVDESVALALALTALVRRSLPAAPLGAVTAPVMGSGKTLLADCIAIIGTGVSSPAMKYADNDEEATKTMLAVLAEGDPVVLIDNVERPLEGDTLCAVLTSENYRQRMLGRTEMMSVPTTTLFMATGNNLVIAGDLRTRALLCRLDPKCEHPEQRQFDGELRELITRQRPELVAAALTIMRAFIATGQRVQDFCKTWGRFERWSDLVRAPLIWLDCTDPCDSLRELEREDPERNELARILAAWSTLYGDLPKTAREAIDQCNGPGEAEYSLNQVLREMSIKDREGKLDAKRFAYWLRQHAGRYVEGRQFVRGPERDHTLTWQVEAMKPK